MIGMGWNYVYHSIIAFVVPFSFITDMFVNDMFDISSAKGDDGNCMKTATNLARQGHPGPFPLYQSQSVKLILYFPEVSLGHFNALVKTMCYNSFITASEQAKRRKYENLDSSFIFVPFGVETLGPWGPEARALFKELSKRVIESTGDPRAGSYLGQRISLAIQRGNAASILGTVPRCGGFEDVLDFI
ncbi:jg7087 [Pararge aegeria aegeria]|uniref:Jg7087 protein n=1 Tax=Pararge aegeria aegeria TaxID=348720 RepID=A0A8S4QZW3_9NEOP|nr:jg7087 [Pararge aegeria aegeria]